ncbi:MAG: proline racemase family protein [Chloroflexota bacterium]
MTKPIVRHYRGATRADVEQAYRVDAQPAISAGYQPVSHLWTQDGEGLLLVVTYQGAASNGAAASVPAAQPAAEAPTGDERYRPPADYYRMPSDAYAPASQEQPMQQAQQVQTQQQAYAQHVQQQQFAQQQAQAQQQLNAQHQAQQAQLPEYGTQAPPQYAAPQIPQQYVAQIAVPVGQSNDIPRQVMVQAQLRPVQAPIQTPIQVPPKDLPAPAPVVSTPAPALAGPTAHTQAEADARLARLTVQTMDLHCAGEPLRIIRSGFPDVPSMPVLDRRRWVMQNVDHVRRAIIQEPRGHRDMYGAILLPPYNDYADMTVLFMHNEGYSTMCGHGIIAITTGLIEEGLYPASEPVTTIRYEVPAGIVAANAATVQLGDGSWAVRGVRFTNVPSYLAAQSLAVRPEGIALYGPSAQYGALSVDIAFGGAYYGIVNAADLGLRVVPEQAEELRRAGAAITDVLRRDHTPQHPSDPALSFVYGTIIVDMDPRTSPDGRATDAHLRNVTIFADAELDRSPCGSGTSALLAQLHARGRMRVGQEIINAGITGEHFLGRIEAETALGQYRAISTSIAGTAYMTGYSTFVVDARDPLGDGFLLGKSATSSAY